MQGTADTTGFDARTIDLPAESGHTLWDRVHDNGVGVVGHTTFRGAPLSVAVLDKTDVLFPTDVGMTLVRAVEQVTLDFEGKRVLDIGCGAGVHTITALMAGAASVTAIDMHPPAVEATGGNVLWNELPLDRVALHAVPLDELVATTSFDVIMCNPPHFPARPEYDRGRGVDLAALGGPDGRSLYDQLLPAAERWLADDGVLVISHSSLTDIPCTKRQFVHAGYDVRIVLRHSMMLNLLAYEGTWPFLLEQLRKLRAQGRAEFTDTRFFVEALAITKARRVA